MVRDITLHQYQVKAITSKKPIVLMLAGKQGGKTMTGSLWMRMQTSMHTDPGSNFIVATPNYKIFSQSTLPRFLKDMNGLGEYHKKDEIFEMSRNRKIFFRSLVDPDSMEGTTDVCAIWGDEAGKYKRRAWENIMGRAARKQAQIMLTTTPYSLNWVNRDLYKPWTLGKRPDVDIFQFDSTENPSFPKEEFERQRALMSQAVFEMSYCGMFSKMQGLVFRDFSEATNGGTLPGNIFDANVWRIFAGVDWGYRDEFAMVIRALNLRNGQDIQIDEVYKKFQTPAQKLSIARELQGRWRGRIESWYCDNEEPATIAEFQMNGITAIPCKKYAGSLGDMIQAHNELIRTGTHKVVFSACPNTIDEYEIYQYKEDKEDKDENPSNNPKDAYDHLMSATMYCSQGIDTLRKSIIAKSNQSFDPNYKTRTQILSRVQSGDGYDPEYAQFVPGNNGW